MGSDGVGKIMSGRIWLAPYLVLLLIIAVAGSVGTGYLGDKARQEIIEYNESNISLHYSHLTSEFDKIERAVMTMSGSPWIVSALISGKEQDIVNANSVLDRYNSNIGSSVCYLMDTNGRTVASSNRNDSDSFVGKSYQFRPYFTQAVKGAPGRYFALGVTSLKRGFYAGYPVSDSKGKIIGVAVIKQDVDKEEDHFVKTPDIFVVDPNGIIFMSGRKIMNFKSLWPVSGESKSALLKSKQFGEREFDSVLRQEVTDRKEIEFYGKNYLVSRKVINTEGWSIILMTTTKRVMIYKSAGIVVTILICSFIIVALLFNKKTHRSAEVVRKSEIRYRQLFERNLAGVYRTSIDGRLIDCNEAFARIYGYESREEAMRHTALDLHVSPAVRQEYIALIKARGMLIDFEARGRRKDGSFIWLLENVTLIHGEEDGHVAELEGTLVDITDRKRTEEALRESEKKYKNILDNMDDGYFEVDTAGNLTFFNDSMCRILGYAANELVGMNNRNYMDDKNAGKIFKVFNKVYRTGEPIKAFDWELIRKDGSKCFVETGVSLITDSDNVKTGFKGIIRDITERKHSEEELHKSFIRLRAALGGTIQALAVTVETRDPYTAGHQRRVADLSRAIANEMGLDSNRIDGIRMAGIIHDIGKLMVPSETLSKPSMLNEIEYRLIKTHSLAGFNILKDIEFPWPIANIVLQHHERLDGSGYPAGLKGEEILMEARIISVADVVEAISSNRPYRPGRGVDAAFEEIRKNRGILFDSAVVDACLRLFLEKGYQLG